MDNPNNVMIVAPKLSDSKLYGTGNDLTIKRILSSFLIVGAGALGTGSIASAVPNEATGTGSLLPQSRHAEMKILDIYKRRGSSGQVAFIRDRFGLSITAIAEIMQVKRPAIYEWLSGVLPRETNQKRLSELYRVACMWEEMGPSRPISRYLTMPVSDTQSLSDMLRADEMDMSQIQDAMRSIADQMNANKAHRKANSIAGRLRAKGFTAPKDKKAHTSRVTVSLDLDG